MGSEQLLPARHGRYGEQVCTNPSQRAASRQEMAVHRRRPASHNRPQQGW